MLRVASSLLVAATLSLTSVDALWPLPKDLSTGTSPLKLGAAFDITLEGAQSAPQDLLDAFERAKGYLHDDKLQRLVPDRGASDKDALGSAPELSSLTVTFTGDEMKSISDEAKYALEDRVEAYTLSVPSDGSPATLSANSSLGLFRGLTTFGQLWYDVEGTTYTIEAPIEISDEPMFAYRGLMSDTARTYFPVEDIKRTLDAMSWVKISTFHWHIVDSQSFPLVIPGFEQLSEMGAYSPDAVFTPEDVADVVSYAAARGIDVIAEIDTPGHTSVIHKVYPEHIACFEASPWAQYAAEPPAGQLRLASKETQQFTADLISAASQLFPSKLFSTGGDEVNAKCYEDDEETQTQLSENGQTVEEALDDFTQATHGALAEQGKTPVVWEEMVLSHNVTLSNETVVLVWISSENVQAVAEKGFKIVHAASDAFYLDCGAGGWVGANPAGNSWCDPFHTWQYMYTFDPLANLTETQSELIIGGQNLLWAEQTNRNNLDSIIWPRAASSAELWWSGPGGNVSTALPRLHDLNFRLDNRGVKSIQLQPLWCALRAGACDLTA